MTTLQKLVLAAEIVIGGAESLVWTVAGTPAHSDGQTSIAITVGAAGFTLGTVYLGVCACTAAAGRPPARAADGTVAAPNGVPPWAPIVGELVNDEPEPAVAAAAPAPHDFATQIDLTAVDVTQPIRPIEPGTGRRRAPDDQDADTHIREPEPDPYDDQPLPRRSGGTFFKRAAARQERGAA